MKHTVLCYNLRNCSALCYHILSHLILCQIDPSCVIWYYVSYVRVLDHIFTFIITGSVLLTSFLHKSDSLQQVGIPQCLPTNRSPRNCDSPVACSKTPPQSMRKSESTGPHFIGGGQMLKRRGGITTRPYTYTYIYIYLTL